jgi:hypothetical protein
MTQAIFLLPLWIAVFACPAHAEEPKPSRKIEWGTTFTTSEAIVTGLGVGATLGTAFVKPTRPRWTATNDVDDFVRDGLRAHSPSTRSSVRTFSDVGLIASVAIPFAGGAVQWLLDKDDEAAARKAGMIVMSFSFTLGSNGVLKNVVARSRPCTRNSGDEGCVAPDAYRSFFSGHAAATMTGATLCWTAKIGTIPCTVNTVLAAATSAGRIIGDKHYFSDVATGVAVGVFSGLALPYLTDIRIGESSAARGPSISNGLYKRVPEPPVRMSILPMFSPSSENGAGLMVSGTFR